MTLRLVTIWLSMLLWHGVTAQGQHRQPPPLHHGSIIITLVSDDTIWVAADSRTSTLTSQGYSANRKGMCKMGVTQNIVYAMTGHIRYHDDTFNFLRLMKTCIAETEDFASAMEHFRTRAQREINSILTKFSAASISRLIATNNGSFLNVVAISFTGGHKQLTEMRFSIARQQGRYVVHYSQQEQTNTGLLRFFGHAAHASAHVVANKTFFGNGRQVPAKLVDLISIEASKSHATVGLPADVLSIYNNGYKRVVSSGLCPAE